MDEDIDVGQATDKEETSKKKPEAVQKSGSSLEIPNWLKETMKDSPESKLLSSPPKKKKSERKTAKSVIIGPYFAGKTTFIRAVSEIEVGGRDPTRVVMDFGQVTLSDDLFFYIFGTPGQKRFDFMWEILAEDMLGFILIVDSARPETFYETRLIGEVFQSYAPTVPYVVAANKQDQSAAFSVNDVAYFLNMDENIPILPMTATSRESAKKVFHTQLHRIFKTPDETSSEQYFTQPQLKEQKKAVPISLSHITDLPNLTVRRAKSDDAQQIASFLNTASLELDYSEAEIFKSYSKYAYLLAEADKTPVGIARFFVENLIMRLELFLAPQLMEDSIGLALVEEADSLAKVLQAEISLVFSYADYKVILQKLDYKELDKKEVKIPIWRVIYDEEKADIAMMKHLRENRVLSPI